MTRWIWALAVALALIGVTGVPPPARGQEAATVRILYDLGDGAYYWSTVTIPDRSAVNASWDASLTGSGMHGLGIEHSWDPVWGIAVHDVGERSSTSGYAALFLWNATPETWELAPVGISDLILEDGAAIAWANAGFDPHDFTVLREPVATPVRPFPVTQFRADGLSGSVSGSARAGTGTSASEAPNSATLLWERNLGAWEIASTPAVAYGRVFVLTMSGLFALDDFTGDVLWSNPRIRGFSSPAVVDGTVIVGSADGSVYAVDVSDGAEVWNTTLLAQTVFSGITSSPRVSMDWVFAGTFNESGGPGEVVALWSSNGTVAWRHPTGSVHYSSPTVIRTALYVGVMGTYNTTSQVTFDPPHGLLSLYRDNGTERWFFPTSGPVAASPVVSGAVAYVASQDGNMYAVWVTNGTERWRVRVGPSISSAALVGDTQPSAIPPTLVVGSGGFGGTGNVTALNPADGSVRWTSAANGPVQSSVAYADGKVFFATNTLQGTVYALNATTGHLVWSHRPAPTNHVLSSPVISNGTLYVGHDSGRVYAYRDEPASGIANVLIDPGFPAWLEVGDEMNMTVTVRAQQGAVTEAVLHVALPGEFVFVSASPSPTQQPGTWTFGAVAFGETRTVTLRILAVATNLARPLPITALLDYSDVDGVSLPREMSVALVHISDQRGPALYLAYVAATVAAIAAVGVLAFFLRRRRRGHE